MGHVLRRRYRESGPGQVQEIPPYALPRWRPLLKELSLLMVFQALGSFEIDRTLNPVQILTFLVFITFYVPCVSTFAVMLKTIGRREALFAVSLSVGVALLVSGIVRFALEAVELLLT